MGRSITGCLPVLAVAVASASFAQTTHSSRTKAGALRCPLSAPYDPDNSFARILHGQLPVSIIAQNSRVMAIVPLEWEYPGHALVIPKRPVRNLYDLEDRDLVALMNMVKRVAAAQQRALGSTGFSLQQNNARAQQVCHLHVHVIPNTPPVLQVHATRTEMDAMAERLRAALPRR